MVCGPNRSYLWILARQKTLSRSVMDELITTAKNIGFKTDNLILVEHEFP
jgi:apolipoprotein D and lipocalin family protein